MSQKFIENSKKESYLSVDYQNSVTCYQFETPTPLIIIIGLVMITCFRKIVVQQVVLRKEDMEGREGMNNVSIKI